jgi:parafibromin
LPWLGWGTSQRRYKVEASLSSEQVSTTAGQAAAAAAAVDGAQMTADGRHAKKARYVVNKEDLDAYKKIVSFWQPKQIADRNTVLRGSHKVNNFGNVRDLI